MTTTVKLITHDWPCAVSCDSNHNYRDGHRSGWGHSNTTEFVPANSERDFAVTDTTSVTFRELPKDATGLDGPEEASGAILGAQAIAG